MFPLKDKTTGESMMVYSVRNVEDRIEFLVYSEQFGFVWNDSSYFVPCDNRKGIIKKLADKACDRNDEALKKLDD